MPLEPLVTHETYEAVRRLQDRVAVDNWGNPLIGIFRGMADLSQQAPYYGVIANCNKDDPHQRKLSNDLRESILRGEYNDIFNVMIVAAPGDGSAAGSYRTIASIDMIAERAFNVLRGKNIFYARHIYDSTYDTLHAGSAVLRVYEQGSRKSEAAFLVPTKAEGRTKDVRRLESEERIMRYFVKKSEPGDYMIIKEVGRNSKTGRRFCVRVVNFMKWDMVFAPDGTTPLVTRISGYSRGSETKRNKINDLPILAADGDFGIGFVPMPGTKDEYYIMVKVLGAASDLYIREAIITDSAEEVITAEKVR